MSSRALRRAQQELEEKKRLERLKEQEEEDDESEEEEAPVSKPKPSLFALLGDDGNDTNDDDDDEEEEEEEQAEAPPSPPRPAASQAKKSKKKKKKDKGKAKTAEPAPAATAGDSAGLDEIDRALQELSVKSPNPQDSLADTRPTLSAELVQLHAVLAVDTQHLKAQNEERRLFGNIALHGDRDDSPRRPRARGQQGPGSRNLGQLGLRKNIFIQGKEEWPRATTGGLAMELVGKRSDGTVEYRFIHNRAYQDVQNQFRVCVETMDSERMIHLLHFNPYHISSLLQVSEIYKQQRENAQAGDLLERALFSFGRAVHSTFSKNLSEGKARLDFRRYENREFWLAVWRYIEILGHRSLWRTAYEWTKLLISLAPDTDPYCMRLLIDQMALRGREPQKLIDFIECDHLQRIYKIPPNFAYSLALAHDRLKEPAKARAALKRAVEMYPWIAARLCKDLDISPIPKSVWGQEPATDFQEMLCAIYVASSKDLWNTPEATALLMEILRAYDAPIEAPHGDDIYWLAEIPELDLARHIILTNNRDLLSLLPSSVKDLYTSVSDPLPPDNSIDSYATSSRTAAAAGPTAHADTPVHLLQELHNGTGTPARMQHILTRLEALRNAELDELRRMTPGDLERERDDLDAYFRRLDARPAEPGMSADEQQQWLRSHRTTWEEIGRNEWRGAVLDQVLREMGLSEGSDGGGDAGERDGDDEDDSPESSSDA